MNPVRILLLPVLLACGSDRISPTEVPVLRDRLVLEDGGDLGVIAPDSTGRQTLPAGGDIEQAMDAAISPKVAGSPSPGAGTAGSISSS